MRWPCLQDTRSGQWQWLPILVFVYLAFNIEAVAGEEDSLNSWTYEWGLSGGYPQQSFKSSSLRPPRINVVQWDEKCGNGYTLLTLRGSLLGRPTAVIVDGSGELVWMDESYGYTMNMKIQEYRGEQYLTFWSGEFGDGFGKGMYYMLDSHYRIFKQFSTAGFRDSDFHEYTITKNNTALLTSYDVTPADLSSMGVKGQGWIYDSLFQELDIETGKLIFEWRASEHYAINDTYYPIGSAGRSPEYAYDFFHINSIDKDTDGNYIISSRFMHSITCISALTGEILWILGGRNNDFLDLSDGSATDFAWQHHVSVQANGMLSIFDNAKYKQWYEEIWDHGEISRGMLVALDTRNMTVELIQEYANPTARGVPKQGSMQVLKSGNVLMGWGYHGAYTEFSADGEILCDTHINPSITFNYGFVHSYRAFRAESWVAEPMTQPSIYLKSGDDRVYVSWVGATEIDCWVLQIARDVQGAKAELVFEDLATVGKDGFETAVELPVGEVGWVRVAAVDRNGKVLATTKVISAEKGTVAEGYGLLVLFGACFLLSLLFNKRLRACGRVAIKRLRTFFASSSWRGSGLQRRLFGEKATRYELVPKYSGGENS